MGVKLAFGGKVSNAIQRLGITFECVAQAVQSPDSVQKIMPEGSDQRDWPIITLYMKQISDGVEESLLLVEALKHGGTVTASAVWQIYPSDLGVDKPVSVIEVFEAFLEKYGIQLKTERGFTKLVMYQVVASSTTIRHGKWERTFRLPESVLNAEDHRITQTPEVCLNKWSRQLNVKMHIAMLYSINLSNYLHDLALHRTCAS